MKITRMTREQAREICGWRYEGEYAVYNFSEWEEAVRQGWSIADDTRRAAEFRAVLDDRGELEGYFRMDDSAPGELELGLGLRPERCGRGRGADFVRLITEYARGHYPDRKLFLEVRSFNLRAVRCYEAAGYRKTGRYRKVNPWGTDDYIRMEPEEAALPQAGDAHGPAGGTDRDGRGKKSILEKESAGAGECAMLWEPAAPGDLGAVMQLYGEARRRMKSQGNPAQWGADYPSETLVGADIAGGRCFVLRTGTGAVRGVFAFSAGEEPNYARIDGAWKNSAPYGTIHRLAGAPGTSGVFDACLAFCLKRMENLRIDTHRDNKIMRHLIERSGFEFCGTIWVEDGTPRLAYQYTKEREKENERSEGRQE